VRLAGLLPLGRSGPTPQLGLALLVAVPFVLGPFEASLFSQFLLFAALAVSLDLVWGYAGVLSLGHAAFFGLGAYSMALVTTRWDAPAPLYLGVVAGTVLACSFAAALGWFIFRGHVAGAYLAILTLAVSLLLEQVALEWNEVTGGFNGIFDIPTFTFDTTYAYFICLAAFLAVYAVARWVVRSPFGRVLVALRDNETRASFFAYDVAAYQTVAFAISGALAGLAGALYAQQVGFVSPSLLGFTLSTEVAIWVMLGGRATLAGAALGAVAINWIRSELSATLLEYYLLVLGLLFIAMVLFLRRGLYPLLDAAVQRVWPRFLVPARWQPASLELVAGPRPVSAAGVAAKGRAALEARAVTKRFKDLRVLNAVDLIVARGELRCLVGPNGAGKTTLLNVMSGGLPAGSGDVFLFGERISRLPPHRVAARGVGRKFQAPSIFPALTVAENLLVPAHGRGNRWWNLLLDRVGGGLDPNALSFLRANGLDRRAAEPATALAHGEQQWLELCMVLAGSPRLLMLDEPTAGLTLEETAETARVIRELARGNELTVLVVEHDMSFVRAFADSVTVLHRGSVLAEGSLAEVGENSEVREVYLGTAT
jgi:branched-chain amino acid transport system permease protein